MKITIEAEGEDRATVSLVFRGETYSETWERKGPGHFGTTGKSVDCQLEDRYVDTDDEDMLEELLELVGSPDVTEMMDFLGKYFYDCPREA